MIYRLLFFHAANVFSQAGNVGGATFVSQSKGQSMAMPLQAQPQLLNSQAPIRINQPQIVNQQGQIISGQNLLNNQLLAMAAAGLAAPQVSIDTQLTVISLSL